MPERESQVQSHGALEDNSLTFSEKILTLRNEVDSGTGNGIAYAGDFVITKVDFSYVHDVQGPLVIKIFKELGGKNVFDPAKVLLNIDHDFPSSSERSSQLHSGMRAFASEQGCRIQEGSNCHQYVLENFIRPGMLVVAADSHTTTLGSVGAFATGMGSSDVASILLSGMTWLRVPETIRISLAGKFNKGVSAKDVALKALGILGTDGANYCSVEWTGPAISAISIDGRSTLTNLALEMGAKNSVVEPDNTTFSHLDSRGLDHGLIIRSGKEAQVKKEFTINLDELLPMVSLPGSPGNARPVSDLQSGIPVTVVLIGTCTNGRLEDLRAVARVLKGKKVSSGTRLIVTPNSREVYSSALKEGIISTIIDSGGIVTAPGCGACAGYSKGLIGDGEVAVFAGPRNFPGRLGSLKSEIYLASPETAARSAVAGTLTAE